MTIKTTIKEFEKLVADARAGDRLTPELEKQASFVVRALRAADGPRRANEEQVAREMLEKFKRLLSEQRR